MKKIVIEINFLNCQVISVEKIVQMDNLLLDILKHKLIVILKVKLISYCNQSEMDKLLDLLLLNIMIVWIIIVLIIIKWKSQVIFIHTELLRLLDGERVELKLI